VLDAASLILHSAFIILHFFPMSQLTSSEPTTRDRGPVLHTHVCSRCGGPVEPLDRFCGACGAEQPVAAQVLETPPRQKFLRCENCGAEVAIDPDQRSYTCTFCDSNYVVEFTPDLSRRQTPEFVIGFAITPEQAMERFRQWLGRNPWFRPSDLKSSTIADKLKGVYLPFWSFSMLARSRWSAAIGEHWYRTETYTTRENGKTVTKTRTVQETEWWNLSGRHHQYYSGYLISGSRGLSQPDAMRIQPFHLAALKRYEPYFLAGWMSEEYSVEREAAVEVCKNEFFRREQNNIQAFLPGDTSRDLRVETSFDDVNSDLILLPIYLLSYRYRDKLYRFMMNGQTGKVAGNKPVSWIKIVLGVVGLILAVLLLLAVGRIL
jgi:hypothetical protein